MLNKKVEDCINYSGPNWDVCPKTNTPVTQLNCLLCRTYFEGTMVSKGLVLHECHHPKFRTSDESGDKNE